MRSIETSGKTVEDAVKTGLQELQLSSSDVTIDVIDMGSPGLFGMFGRLAKVRLTVKEEDSTLDFEMPVMSLDQQKTKPAKSKPEKKQPKPERAPVPAKEAVEPIAQSKPQEKPKAEPMRAEAPAESTEERAPRREERTADRPLRNRPPKAPKPPRPEPLKETEDLPPLDLSTLSEKAQTAYDFLLNTTKLMGVDVEIRMVEGEGTLTVQMIGDTLGILIGRRGDTLDALQYLTSLQVNKNRDDYTRVTLDTEHYRAKREEALDKLANRMANRVRRTGHRVALEPMNPYERRILHSALQGNPYVSTHSEGEEPYRRVIITLK